MESKNSRVGKTMKGVFPSEYALPRYVAGNVGAKWKTKCKGLSKKLDFRIRRKIGKHMYQRIGVI